MATVEDKMKDKITLHGLGFIQVQLEGDQRLHVWHPDLPRRKCFEHSCIHDHRFSFESTVLVGSMVNQTFAAAPAMTVKFEDLVDPWGKASTASTARLPKRFISYVHEGPRTACGGRPWVPDGKLWLRPRNPGTLVLPGQSYRMSAYEYHRTIPEESGKVATIMRKLGEGTRGAHSLCVEGVTPDDQFDRYQLSPAELWEYVLDVLGGVAIDCKIRG